MSVVPESASVEQVRYVNRELSWINFNSRVLEEALAEDNPLLERCRFLSIFESNLDEFYMVRVSGLIMQADSHDQTLSPDGLTPAEQIQLIHDAALPLRRRAGEIFKETLKPLLEKQRIFIKKFSELDKAQRERATKYFLNNVFPLCTPLVLHPAPSVPFISNRSLNLAVELSSDTEKRLARVKVPNVIDRLVPVQDRGNVYIDLADLIANHLGYLFPGVEIKGSYQFRVIRDADIEIKELDAADLLATVERTVKKRRYGQPVMLQLEKGVPHHIRRRLMKLLELQDEDVFDLEGMLGFEVMDQLVRIDRPALKYAPFQPYLAESLSTAQRLFETLNQRDVFVQQPFDSFKPVEELVHSAAEDPQVIGIKQTLYRVGSQSPIVESLMEAADNGKQVAVLVELKARFDESNNLIWARALERAGVHVTYGFAELKTHCKLALIVRQGKSAIKVYAHIGTGNYNPITARLYTDLGLFTTDLEIIQELLELFNFLTGFSKQADYQKILVAPLNLREGILERIKRETELQRSGTQGEIFFKMNSLVDPEMIDALYEASEAGVRVRLVVRGICCLRPGVKGQSENIEVRSVIGRYLEHSRCYYFGNGEQPEVYIGSADLMRRNLDRRVEVLTPIEDPKIIDYIRNELLAKYWEDNVKAWEMSSDGGYSRRTPGDEEPFVAQEYFMNNPTTKVLYG
ncbi:MAG: polyphosphate kinase 1 [Fimbriimonadaceae bacterium]